MHSSCPGYDIIEEGLEDLKTGRETIHSLLVSMASGKLRSLGYVVSTPLANPEIRCYLLIANQLGDGAHSRYNAYRRRLASFLRAASCVNSSTATESDRS